MFLISSVSKLQNFKQVILFLFQWCLDSNCVSRGDSVTSKIESLFNPSMAQDSLNVTPYYVNMVEPYVESSSPIRLQINNKESFFGYQEKDKSFSSRLGKWSAWSAYSDCENNCNKLRKSRFSKRGLSSKSTLSYSKFKGVQISTRSCKFPTNSKNDGRRVGSRRCIGPTHRYQQCSSLQVWYNINSYAQLTNNHYGNLYSLPYI